MLTSCTPIPEPTPPFQWASAISEGTLNRDPTRNANYPQLLSYQDQLYVTWYENTLAASQIRVAHADLSQPGRWTSVDGDGALGLNANPAHNALWSRLIGSGGRLYLSWWEEEGDGTTSIRLATTPAPPATVVWTRLEGASTGLRYATTGKADYPALEVYSGRLYAAWREGDPGQGYEVRVAVMDGTLDSPHWTFVDRGATRGGANRDPLGEGYYPKLLTFGSDLYLMWYELNGMYRTMRCARYNGNDAVPAWPLIDGDTPDGLNFDPHKDAHGPQLLAVDGSLYGLWYERGADITSHVRVTRYSGSGTSWSFVDGNTPGGLNRSPVADAWWPRAVATGSHLTVAWSEAVVGAVPPTYRIRVSDLDTRTLTWTTADGGTGLGGDTGPTEYPHLARVGQRLYLAYSERENKVLQLRVMTAEAP